MGPYWQYREQSSVITDNKYRSHTWVLTENKYRTHTWVHIDSNYEVLAHNLYSVH